MRFLPILLLILLASVLFIQLGQPVAPPREDSWPIGQKVPGLLLPLLSNESQTTLPLNFASSNAEDRHGYLLNFFASWCAPCIAELPVLKNLQQQHGIPIIGVAWKDSPAALKKFFATHERPYAQILLDADGKGMTELGATGVPESFLVDANGVILRRYRSNLQPADADEIAALLKAPAVAKDKP